MAGMAVYWEAPLEDLRRMITTTTISIPMGEPATYTYRNTQGVVVQLSSVVPRLLTTQSSRRRRQSWTPQTPQEMPRLVPQERVSRTDGQGQAPREVKEAMEIPPPTSGIWNRPMNLKQLPILGRTGKRKETRSTQLICGFRWAD